jgi:hypothetical protein
MSREETVLTTTIAIHYVDKYAYLRIVGWSPSGHQRFYYLIVDSAGQEYTQPCPTQH